MFFSGVFDEAISGRSTLEDHWSRRGHFLSMSAMEQSEAMTTWPHGNLRLPSQCHLKPQKIRLIKGLLRDNDWPYFLGGLALGGVPLDSHYDHGIFFLWFNKWLLLGGLGSGVGGLDSWNFVVKGIATLRVTLLGTTSPLIVPLWNGEALPLQNGHFPTHFINDKKVVQIQGDLQSWMSKEKVVRPIL